MGAMKGIVQMHSVHTTYKRNKIAVHIKMKDIQKCLLLNPVAIVM